MLLAFDIGNTNVVAGLFEGEALRAEMRVSTARDRTADEWLVLWESLLRVRGYALTDVGGACIASVVPGLIAPFQAWLGAVKVPTVTCRGDMALGVGVDVDNPSEVGIDRILNCVARKTCTALRRLWWTWGQRPPLMSSLEMATTSVVRLHRAWVSQWMHSLEARPNCVGFR